MSSVRTETYTWLQFLVTFTLIRVPSSAKPFITTILGPTCLVLGLSIMAKGGFDLGKRQLSPWPTPVFGGQLKTRGLYGFVRHPMYLGAILASVGFSCFTGSLERLLLSLLLVLIFLKKVEREETLLLERFGDEFVNYCLVVRYQILPLFY
eukprot:jgi/Galph1/4548/GphlegSOOS_G3202.1